MSNASPKKQSSAVYLHTYYIKDWQRGGLCYHDNGGRKANECYSATLVVGKRSFSILVYPIGHWRLILRFLPVFGRRKTLSVGILPKGAKEE